jgi:hypothetical protein
MSELRKVRRTMAKLNKPRRPPATDVMLLIGVILLIIGLLSLGLNYLYSTGPKPVLPGSQPAGKQYPDKQALENSFRDTAIFSVSAAGAGLVLAASALLTKYVQKKIKQA